MKHLGLFEGIGGFSLAARWMGWETIAWCEINPFCQKVLSYHFPHADKLTDIKTTDFTKYANRIDIITGGFPCQPYSLAGKRKGKEDDRHLWPEMLRAIREVNPKWIVGENVFGLVNWSGGLVFEEVQADLENEGYEVQSYILPACGKDAPHKRDRIWFVAHANINGRSSKDTRGNESESEGSWIQQQHKMELLKKSNNSRLSINPNSDGNRYNRGQNRETYRLQGFCGKAVHAGKPSGTTTRNATDTNSQQRSERRMHTTRPNQAERHFSPCDSRNDWRNWENFPTQSPLCSGNDGLPRELDGITFSKWRTESIKAYGNAVVPQIPFEIFKAIQAYEDNI